MTAKNISNLRLRVAELKEAIESCCFIEGALSEKQKWYYIRKLHQLRTELRTCEEDLKEAIHEKLTK